MPGWEPGNRWSVAVPMGVAEPRWAGQQSASHVDPESVDLPVLRALLRISQVVLNANYFDEVLEGVAEQALIALDAASVSISRWERTGDVLRTLINVGELSPGEKRWPDHEFYPVTGDAHVARLLQHGRPYLNAIDAQGIEPTAIAWLNQLGKESELAVPVMYEDVMWGELWVTGVNGRRFGPDDVQLLQAIAAHVAQAISRSELLSTVWQYAYQDPLTGLANRRALDQRFGARDWAATRPVLLVCDLDGFKEVNDRDGHPAGDAMLRRVAGVLSGVASSTPGSIVARVGGDEFCIVLPDSTLADAEQFARRAGSEVRRLSGSGDITLSWGASSSGGNGRSGPELFATADAALLEAKRLGFGRFSTGVAGPEGSSWDPGHRHATSRTARRAADRLVPRVVQLLDELTGSTSVSALEILAAQVHHAIDAAAWSLWVTAQGGTVLRRHSGLGDGAGQGSGGASARLLADYPATAMAIADGSAFIAARELWGSDPAETALLERLGHRAVLAVGGSDGDRGYLLAVYSDEESPNGYVDLAAIEPHVRVLARYCLAVRTGTGPTEAGAT